MSYLTTHWLEVSGALISLVYLYFSVRQIIWLWPFGILSALLYSIVFGTNGFYASMGLQGYYLGISVYGWWNWSRRRGRGVDQDRADISLRVTMTGRRTASIAAVVFLLLWLVLSWMLDKLTDSTVPVWDALTTAGGIVATWMLARKLLEHWLVWIFVDTVAWIVYLNKGLYPTAILYMIYTVIAVVGFVQWRKTMAQ